MIVKKLSNTDIIFASNNQGKCREIELALGVKLVTPADLNYIMDVAETGDSFATNALLKAEALYNEFKHPVLADDSGLMVVALPYELGVQSARFGGEEVSSLVKNQLLIKKMCNIMDRRAYFVCHLVLYLAQENYIAVQSTWHGSIATVLQGSQGFGYDPVFIDELGRCAANLTAQEKSVVSHRGKACVLLKQFMITLNLSLRIF
jgi:non-canonical purine NTP pyrophosphatase (RdgB/HAM1 family)